MELIHLVACGDPLKFDTCYEMNALKFLNLAAYMYDRQIVDASIREAAWKKQNL
jgi:hypothetical protein